MVLITGGSGQLGTSLQRIFWKSEILAPTHRQLDITDQTQVEAFFQTYRPDVVLHCAAYNNVDFAEKDQARCCAVNVEGTRNLVEAARKNSAYLIYTSSDYVFDGIKDGIYEPADYKNPLSVYGASKSAAEDLVLTEARNAVIRISWLFGPGDHNFVKAILRAAEEKQTLCVVNDQVGSPTYTEDLAQLMQEMLKDRPSGILHATNEGFCTRAQFAEEILNLSSEKADVQEVSTLQYPSAAQRPLNSRLSKASLDVAGLHRLPAWEDALARYLTSNDER